MQHMGTQVPYEAFAFIEAKIPEVRVTACIPDTDTCRELVDSEDMLMVGSGVAVADSRVHDGRQYVMTAGHICDAADELRRTITRQIQDYTEFDDVTVDLTMTLKVNDNQGGVNIAKVIGLNPDRDICILAVEGAQLPVVPLADDYPKKGSTVSNIAAPQGSWQAGSTHRFDGYYSGPYSCEDTTEEYFNCEEGEAVWSYFTVAAAPGSSGSPIFDRHGRLIGIVVRVLKHFPNVAIAVRLEDMRALLGEVLEFEKTPEGLSWKPNFDEVDSVTGATVKVD